jgi:hypothetical protein
MLDKVNDRVKNWHNKPDAIFTPPKVDGGVFSSRVFHGLEKQHVFYF